MSLHYLVKCKKSHFLVSLIIGASCPSYYLIKLKPSQYSRSYNLTHFLAYCFVFVMKVKVSNNNRFFSQSPSNLLFSKPPTFS